MEPAQHAAQHAAEAASNDYSAAYLFAGIVVVLIRELFAFLKNGRHAAAAGPVTDGSDIRDLGRRLDQLERGPSGPELLRRLDALEQNSKENRGRADTDFRQLSEKLQGVQATLTTAIGFLRDDT